MITIGCQQSMSVQYLESLSHYDILNILEYGEVLCTKFYCLGQGASKRNERRAPGYMGVAATTCPHGCSSTNIVIK